MSDHPNHQGPPGPGGPAAAAEEAPPSDQAEQKGPTLDQEIARKYDPAALSRLVMRDAGRGEPLDLHTRSQMERRLGADFSNVRVFRGPLAEEITHRYRADAVTVGSTEMILVREGWRANTQTAAGRSLLAHELTHVRQQQRGLHFARGGGGGEGEHEEEAELVEQSVYAEELGHSHKDAAKKHKQARDRKLMSLVKKRVMEMVEEAHEKDQARDGNFGQT